MKKIKIALMISTTLLCMSSAYAQTVRVGSITNGITASGNSLSIANGNNSLQVNGVPPVAQGAVSAIKEMMSGAGTTDTSKITPDNLAKLDAAKSNFLKQKEEADKVAVKSVVTAKKENQEQVRVGQDLRTIKSNLVTNNISFYNKETINQIEGKALEENPKMYLKFPEYMLKNY